VRNHTGDHVRPGPIGGTRDAHVPVAIRQEEGGGTFIGAIARARVRHRRRAGGAAAAARGGAEAKQQVQGSNIVHGHGPRVNRRHGTAQFPVVFGHQRAHILRRVHIQEQQQQYISTSQLHHHRGPPSE